MNKKIIFLDIDGVLATEKEYFRVRRKLWKKYDIANKLQIPYPFNEGCVKILNYIIKETDAELVITSDWRIHWTLEELCEIFKFNGVEKMPIGTTDKGSLLYTSQLEKERIDQIDEYIKNNKIKNYVIIDDLNLNEIIGFNRFVKTNSFEGLKQTNVKEKIIKFLSK